LRRKIMKKNSTKKTVYAAICVALGVVLPIAFHSVQNAGSIFLPMHIPVLLCGLLCGPWYGLVCGILAPVLSSTLTGMPPAAILPSMVVELAVYGLVAGLMKKATKNNIVSLVTAMLAGRVVSGLAKAFIFNAGNYGIKAWLTGSFVTALPGIIIQLILIPVIMIALEKAKLTPED
jgi:thiamine transporter ThiT